MLFLPQDRADEQLQGLISLVNQYVSLRWWRIRGHSQLQGKHEAFEEVFWQLWDLFREDLTDEGDELVVLVTQRGELENKGRIKPTDVTGRKQTDEDGGSHLQQVLGHEG